MLFRKALVPFIAAMIFCLQLSAAEEKNDLASGHLGPIASIAVDTTGIAAYTAAKDGSIVKWDLKKKIAIDRFQVSPYGLTCVALRPNTEELAVIETDGLGLYRISAWNFKEKRRLFSLRFRDAVQFISYSEKGSFLIVARNSYEGIVLLDPTSGEKINQLQEATGLVTFTATGKSERTMATYAASGDLCYWNVATGERIQRVKLPPSLSSPTLFGNGRFFFGSTGTEMVILDALSAKEIARRPLQGTIAAFPSDSDTAVLRYLISANEEILTGVLSITSDHEAVFEKDRLISQNPEKPITFPVSAVGKLFITSSGNGTAAVLNTEAIVPIAEFLKTKDYLIVKDVSYSGDSLFAIVDGSIIRVPSSHNAIKKNQPIERLKSTSANRIIAFEGGELLAWNSNGTAPPKLLMNDKTEYEIPQRPGSVISAVRRFKDNLLFLDSAGTLTIFDLDKRTTLFSYTSIGILDAVIVDERRLVVGKSSAVTPKVPLLSLNYKTGETAPLDIPGKAAVRLHRGESGYIYAILAGADESGTVTRLVRFDPELTTSLISLVEYHAEDVQASIAEIGNSVATTLGGDGASIFKPEGFSLLERTEYLPKRLTAAGTSLVALGDDGALVWYDAESGKSEAILRILKDRWELTRGENTESGPFADR